MALKISKPYFLLSIIVHSFYGCPLLATPMTIETKVTFDLPNCYAWIGVAAEALKRSHSNSPQVFSLSMAISAIISLHHEILRMIGSKVAGFAICPI